jgi:RNA polymerase sigma-70 factor (ECF subfamily)
MDTAIDDSKLLQRIRNGALDDFGELVQRHQAQVFRILSRYERDALLVEDLAQDTFVKAFRALHQYDGRAPFEHWLSRIAVHVAIDHIRARRDREVRFSDLSDEALDWLHLPDPQDGPGPRDAREILDVAMHSLKAEEKLVLKLLELEDRSIKEIAAMTGWSSVTVRVRAFRARAKLKEALEALEQKR